MVSGRKRCTDAETESTRGPLVVPTSPISEAVRTLCPKGKPVNVIETFLNSPLANWEGLGLIADFLAFQRLDGEDDRDVGRGAQDLAEFEGCTNVFDVDRCAVSEAEGGFVDQHGACLEPASWKLEKASTGERGEGCVASPTLHHLP